MLSLSNVSRAKARDIRGFMHVVADCFSIGCHLEDVPAFAHESLPTKDLCIAHASKARLPPKLAKDSYQGTALAVPPSSACRFPERASSSRGIPPFGPSTTDVILRKRRPSLREGRRRR